MFTGIVTDIGRVAATTPTPKGVRLGIEATRALDDVAIGASIACAGVCLTVVALDAPGRRFDVEASAETLARTTLGGWAVGTAVNLERALRVGDELGGHIVSGHVDGVADVLETRPEGDSLRVDLLAPATLAAYLAPKGSVALDGCSLTVNEVADTPEGCRFGVNLIRHTWRATTLGRLAPSDRLNLEVDTIARYIVRAAGLGRA